MAADETFEPEPYEPGPPTTHEDADEEPMSGPPPKHALEERHERFSRPRKAMGPDPEDDRRKSPEEHGLHADVPPSPAPEPADEPENA